MTQDGVYLLEDGESMLMWVGQSVNISFLQSAFRAASFDSLDTKFAEGTLREQANPLAQRIVAIIDQVRLERRAPYMLLTVMKQSDQRVANFFASLIEDRTHALQNSFTEFMQ